MSLRTNAIGISILLFLAIKGVSQQRDSTLTYTDFISQILAHHPLSLNANLQNELSQAELLEGKGALDPKIYATWDQKDFDSKQYYQKYQTKISVPTTIGVDIVAGYDFAQGVFINPENKTTNSGLWNVGLEANLLQGMFMNERKLNIQQSRVYANIAENERQILLNQLLLEASATYFIWQQYKSFEGILEENQNLAQAYLENTKTSFINGEKTAVDTLEAFLLFQDSKIERLKNEQNLAKAHQLIQSFIWDPNIAISGITALVPEPMTELNLSLDLYEEKEIQNNPQLQSTILKKRILEIEQKLKIEKLKPKLKVKYNPLLGTNTENILPIYDASNYKWGVDFSMPLFLRTERAQVQKGNLKIQTLENEIASKSNELSNKIRATEMALQNFGDQIELLEKNIENYRLLLEAEREKFSYGESSIFLLNKRQEKYIDGQLKLVESRVKARIEFFNYLFLINQIDSDF